MPQIPPAGSVPYTPFQYPSPAGGFAGPSQQAAQPPGYPYPPAGGAAGGAMAYPPPGK